MQISIDGGLSWIDAPEGVKVSYEINIWDGDDVIEGELVVQCTEEGIISDIVSFDGVVGTESETAQEIVDRLTE